MLCYQKTVSILILSNVCLYSVLQPTKKVIDKNMPDQKHHTPKSYLVKKPRNHPEMTSANMVGGGALFYFYLKLAQQPIYLIKILYFHQSFICLAFSIETLWAFPSLDPVEINVDSKANFLWPFLYQVQSLFLPVPPWPILMTPYTESLKGLPAHTCSDTIMMLLMTTPLLII